MTDVKDKHFSTPYLPSLSTTDIEVIYKILMFNTSW
jgi:hypothetical protein